MNCSICTRIEAIRRGESPNLVHEFANSYLVVGDHQFFAGYCVLLLKPHVRELHETPQPVRGQLFDELMTATEAIVRAYRPWKMNHASLGNQDPHVHWHLFPRYESDPDRRAHPFLHADEFAKHPTMPDLAREVAVKVRGQL